MATENEEPTTPTEIIQAMTEGFSTAKIDFSKTVAMTYYHREAVNMLIFSTATSEDIRRAQGFLQVVLSTKEADERAAYEKALESAKDWAERQQHKTWQPKP